MLRVAWPSSANRVARGRATSESFCCATRIVTPRTLERETTTRWDGHEATTRRFVRARATIGEGRGMVHVRIVNGDIELRRAGSSDEMTTGRGPR
jgi:hypothetical protein